MPSGSGSLGGNERLSFIAAIFGRRSDPESIARHLSGRG
jgi:hypothetical protein